jgi:hypothetical protein
MAEPEHHPQPQGGGRARLSRRHRRIVTLDVATAGALLCLLDLQHAWQYCTLCGKDRDALSLVVPHVVLLTFEQSNDYSDVLDPLVHNGLTAHAWADVDRSSLLVRLLQQLPPLLGTHGSGGLRAVRDRNAELVQRLAIWDAELAVAAGQYLISGSRDPNNDEDRQLADDLVRVPSGYPLPPHLEDWNRARAAFGLPPLGDEEYSERVKEAAERLRQWREARHSDTDNGG